MWLLENKEAFDGRRLWLKPGKTYLFGRTAAEPGQLAISHNTISRKHLTITVDDVAPGQAHHPSNRSKLTIEDLGTKIGTVVNGEKLKGSKTVLGTKEAEIIMGKCPNKFRLSWFPIVLSFSFTSKELQTDPLMSLRDRFEHLDIKLLTEYNTKYTTHVVSKKRNTAKGLQALIHGRHIVQETFLDAVASVAEIPEGADAAEPSALEQDFDRYWPDAMQHLPPRGGEPVQHPDDIYAPDVGRKDIFDGYTFIFYDDGQYKNLMAAVTNGGGKPLLRRVTPNETEVDDFIRYVKSVAGEKGLGSFEDGSEGKGVVLVRYVPAKGTLVDWYTEFFTSVSLRLDHRPIEQSEFLEAILIKDATILRRPLEMEESLTSQGQYPAPQSAYTQPSAVPEGVGASTSQPRQEEVAPPSRGLRRRRPVQRRFAGFDDDDDASMDVDGDTRAPAQSNPERVDDEAGLFVSQEPDFDEPFANQPNSNQRQSQRKRKASLPRGDLMEGMAPAVAQFKKQRLESGRNFASPTPDPVSEGTTQSEAAPRKKIKKEIDVLALAAQHRQEEEARARAEKEDLAQLPDDVDLSEIRRLNIVEEMEVRAASGAARTREQDIADGRWNPKWNGLKNFKKFRRRGEATGRPPARTIVPLTQVKTKEFGVGDGYWLDEEDTQSKKKTTSQPSALESEPTPPVASSRLSKRVVGVVISNSSDEEDNSVQPTPMETSQSRGTFISQSQDVASAPTRSTRSQRTAPSTGRSQGKRPAPEHAQEEPAKRQRPATRKAMEFQDSDDSDDELKFRFGKRR
ncbi:hypothetical protein S40293_02560 [Stachybotrys chartarum IBT 40293]|nr:hypothetical protein S40293_02560 [Stachybotrys chartarum IBT 40293]